MTNEEKFEILYDLGTYLKAGPLTDMEKNNMRSEYLKASGSTLERAYTTLEKVFHTKKSVILEGRSKSPEVEELLQSLQKASYKQDI